MKTKEELIIDRDIAIRQARCIMAQPYIILDTETTGLTNAQMCQLAILYHDGTQYKSLVKPTIPIEEGASKVHHITDEDVKDAPEAPAVVQKIPIWTTMVIYNAPFDLGIMRQSLQARGSMLAPEVVSAVFDAMQIYSSFRGEWDDYHGNYRWHKLGAACQQCKIEIDVELHDALSDCIMTERLLKYMAAQKLSTEVDEVIPG